jgi:glycosyltransferase involved in cell wall biosynthesis
VRRIAICNTSIEPGDAVSNDMLGMYDVLASSGYEVRLFAETSSIENRKAEPLAQLDYFLESPDDIFIYHYATGWTQGMQLLKNLRCKKVVRYHNVTPSEFFEAVDSGYAGVCRAGRSMLADLIKMKLDLYLANSAYSKRELVQEGLQDHECRVVPPFHQVDRLQQLDADLTELARYSDDMVNILTVGRLAPNKNHPALIDAFSIYHNSYNPQSRLLIVGGDDIKLQSYTRSLRSKVRQLGLEKSIIFTGKVSDAVLKALYLAADVFMTTSLHEGFCVPLVESMSLKIPIVAFATTAVKETVGKAAIAWEEYDPELLAASIEKIMSEESLRVSLGHMGWLRYREAFTKGRIRQEFLEILEPLL